MPRLHRAAKPKEEVPWNRSFSTGTAASCCPRISSRKWIFPASRTLEQFAAVVKRDFEQKARPPRICVTMCSCRWSRLWKGAAAVARTLKSEEGRGETSMNLEKTWQATPRLATGVLILALLQVCAVARSAIASSAPAPVPPVADPCPRSFAAGDVVQNPAALFSSNGVLSVRVSYQHRMDAYNRDLFCFMTPEGMQNPTLHVKPGDHLIVTPTNNTPAQQLTMTVNPPNCGASSMGPSSVNIHYHGTNTSPTCGADEVIRTVVNSGETFQYDVAFPSDEPPGLYWYHPHIHGLTEAALEGGAAGAIVVEGIENVQPAVSGLRQRILIVRDQETEIPGEPTAGSNVPSWDVTLNYVPVLSPGDPGITDFVPARLLMQAGEREFWRGSNSSSARILH